jgi:hypothetical protein
MAGSRTLKLSILADIDDLKKNLNTGSNEVESFGDKVGKFGKMAAAAFAAAAAAAAAYAVKIGIDGVKAAIEDEKAQTQLALALKNATGATEAQIKATEDAILKMSLATGVADDKLRPALARLARSTDDVGKAQELLSLALDVSTATGKPLEAVANSLGKAYDGNTAALGKLGVGLSSAELKTMTFTQVQSKLTDLFGGAAAANAETYSGRLARMQVAFDEVKETIGYALLPILEKAMRFINTYAQPVLDAFTEGLDGKSGLGYYLNYIANTLKNFFLPIWDGLVYAFNKIKDAIADNAEGFMKFGKLITDYVAPILGSVLGSALKTLGDIAGGVLNIIGKVAGFIADVVETAIKGVNALIRAYNSIPLLPNIPQIPTASVPTVTVPKVSSSSIPTPSVQVPNVPVPPSSSGASTAASSAAKATSGVISTANVPYEAPTMGYNPLTGQATPLTIAPTINIGVAGDPEGVARTVVDVLNRSYGRGALGAEALIL